MKIKTNTMNLKEMNKELLEEVASLRNQNLNLSKKNKELKKQLPIHVVVKPFYCETKRCKEDGSGQCIECALFELNKEQ